jgi:hypothetical protein
MTRKLICALLLLGTPMLCQQPPNSDPTTSDAQVAPQNMADQSEQPLQDKAARNERIQNNLQSSFDDDPTLSGAEVAANVDDRSITLTGKVQSYLQHQRVLQLVSPYYGYRTVVDKVTVE